MAGKWKRRCEDQVHLINSLRRQIVGHQTYERTLQLLLESAKKDAADARRWAEQAEKGCPMNG